MLFHINWWSNGAFNLWNDYLTSSIYWLYILMQLWSKGLPPWSKALGIFKMWVPWKILNEEVVEGSKYVTKSQTYYFGKGLQVFFFKNIFNMQINFWMKFFVTCSKKYLSFSQCIIWFFVSHYWNNMNFLKFKFLMNLMFHLEKWSKS